MNNFKEKAKWGGVYSRRILIISILFGIFLFIGISYAIWQITLQQETKNVITTGCFKVEFSDTNPIDLDKAYPITDDEGASLTPYEFTITNTCDSNASYQINLEILNTTTLTDLNILKMNLNEKDKKEEMYFLTNYDTVTKTLEKATTAYKLRVGYFKANESKTFELRMWMDESTEAKEEYMNKVFESKITIIANHIIDENSPEVITSTSNALNSITVDASESFDEDVGIETYYFRLENESWNESNEPIYTFYNLDYKEYNIEIQAEDHVGNKSEIKSVKEFPKVKATDYVNSLNGNGEVLNDETLDDNVRYIGTNPNNYVLFNNELWRIIGSMNNIYDGTGKKETRIKLIRNESIGEYSWDTSASNVNSGYGVNEWSEADLNILLNDYYYNGKSNQTCYNGNQNETTNCSFNEIGLQTESKKMITEAVWHTGSTIISKDLDSILTSEFYDFEKSTNPGKVCKGGDLCNDNVTRTTTWTGIIGLMYPSDYGYATSGKNDENRLQCLSVPLGQWNDHSNCYTSSWINKINNAQWTITPIAYDYTQQNAHRVASIHGSNKLSFLGAYHNYNVHPSVYLKSNVKLTSGIGTENRPFILSLD